MLSKRESHRRSSEGTVAEIQFTERGHFHNIEDQLVAAKFLPKFKRLNYCLSPVPALHQREAEVTAIVKRSLQYLQVDYIDLYLIHWPGVSGLNVTSSENKSYRTMTWTALAKLHKSGHCRSIGVSNYNVAHLEELLADCDDVPPSVNQCEWHPRYHQPELAKFCQQHNIFLQAYSSLGTSDNLRLLNDETVMRIAQNVGRTTAQVIKSTTP